MEFKLFKVDFTSPGKLVSKNIRILKGFLS